MTKVDTQSGPIVGVVLAERIYAGVIVDHRLVSEVHTFPAGPGPADPDEDDSLVELPADALMDEVCKLVATLAESIAATHPGGIRAVGLALPGFVRNGVMEEAPNVPQLKGARLQEILTAGLTQHGITAPVTILNDADGFAAGLASKHGKLDRLIRLWTIGFGIGYGRYPFMEGVWEGGHSVVSLDEKERYCGCGGRGHLEGIMGHRAMRLRFLDMEPEEVFAQANKRDGDPRCVEFKRLWHKSLAAATATAVHIAGPGKFFLAGFNTRFVDMNMLKDYMHQMVKMSPLQGYSFEIVPDDAETRLIGAAISAESAAAS